MENIISKIPLWVNVKDAPFNAKGDGITDDTPAIQAAINSGSNVYIPDGVYKISINTGGEDTNYGILISAEFNNKTLYLSFHASLVWNYEESETLADYSIIYILGADSISVIGGALIGDRYENTFDIKNGVPQANGAGIYVSRSNNINIMSVAVKSCHGDGFYIGQTNGTSICKNINLINCTAENNRRNGCSLMHLDGGIIHGCTFNNTNGSPDMRGIDIEPELGDLVSNILINNCKINDNGGTGINLSCGGGNISDITIKGNSIYNNGSLDGVSGLAGIYITQDGPEKIVPPYHYSIKNIFITQNHLWNNKFKDIECNIPPSRPTIVLTDNIIK